MERDRVTITDVTLREFGQNVPAGSLHVFTPRIRGEIATELMDLGFQNLEVLSCIHPKIAPAMHEPALREIAESLGRRKDVHIITLVPNLSGYETFCSLGLGPDGYNHTLGIFFSAVEAHNRANLGRSIADTLAEYKRILKDAAQRRIRAVAYISATFGYLDSKTGSVIRADLTDIRHSMDMLFDLGARTVTLSDLQGVADQGETFRILDTILQLRKGKDRERMGYHPHHLSADQALANSRVAFDAGIRRFDASLGGTGGCVTGAPGNQPTEELVRHFSEAGVETGIDVQGVVSLANRVVRDLYSRIALSPPMA
ncbi:MAG: hypothetical protein K9M96_00545 [Deltaproteobacteria bacterium]|nr:hypothetical protein [Deltaproteobacteria bacterium]